VNNIRQLLEHNVTGHRYIGNVTDVAMEMYLLRRGQTFPGCQLPSPFKYKLPRECFHNSRLLAARHPSLRYAEGLAITTAKGMSYPTPIHHAWCLDRGNRVIDATWEPFEGEQPENWQYIGVAFSSDMLKETQRYVNVDSSSLLGDQTTRRLNLDWMMHDCRDLRYALAHRLDVLESTL
jgi:hypothetical protein